MPTSSIRTRTSPAACALLTLWTLGACKPAAQKTPLGPFSTDRYEEKTADGVRLDCYLLGGESNKPARLCGEGQPTPGFSGVLFNAVAPAPGSRFASAVGEPAAPGWYLIRGAGSSAVDLWPLGRLPTREWLGGGKVLLAVESGTDHHTRVRLIDPQTRSDRVLDAGLTRADTHLLVRAPGDAHVLLVQRLGGEELILLRDPLGNAEVLLGDASDDKSAGNRRFFHRGDLARQNGGNWTPTAGDLAAITWKGDLPLFENQPMGPFDPPRP